jgi:predicted nucleotidyltransferase
MAQVRQPNRILDELAARLAAQPGIAFASIFGSVAKGTARSDGDVDVGVFADAPLGHAQRRKLVGMVAEVTGRPVDLIDLREAGPLLLMSVLRGTPLVGEGSRTHASLLSRAWLDAADFLPVRKRLLEQRRRAWTG